jgi:hypothetical protein
MATRAAICIGIDQAGSMPALKAAARGARDFEQWARSQHCDTTLLVDDGGTRVALMDVFDAVAPYVAAATYEQLFIYFSGHGFITGPDAEFWLLSRAPENGNEAINLRRSIADAENCGIPHIVFVSDACRSSAGGPPLTHVIGGTVFSSDARSPSIGEIDVFYATRPGDPAWEVPLADALTRYGAVFTDFLLDTVRAPVAELVDAVPGAVPPRSVLTARKLKPHLESRVPIAAASHDIRLRQTPVIKVGTWLPKFFAEVDPATIDHPSQLLPPAPVPSTLEQALFQISGDVQRSAAGPPASDMAAARRFGLTDEVEELVKTQGRPTFETRTGFTFHGAKPVLLAAPGWDADPPFEESGVPGWHLRLRPLVPAPAHSVVVLLDTLAAGANGMVLAVFPEFIGSVTVDTGCRVTNINYVPARNSWRYDAYQPRADEIERIKAHAAIAWRNGEFTLDAGSAAAFAERARVDKSLDPTLGIYAAYAYARAARAGDVQSILRYMEEDSSMPVPFDVVLLAGGGRGMAVPGRRRIAPFVPMLSQGWTLLTPADAIFLNVHERLRRQQLPSIWTTLTGDGAAIAAEFVTRQG